MSPELHLEIIYENNLDTDKFARMFNNKAQSYKFYWFEAILNLIKETNEDLTFEEIIEEMQTRAPGYRTCVRSLCAALILGMLRIYSRDEKGRVRDPYMSVISPALDYIHENYMQDKQHWHENDLINGRMNYDYSAKVICL